MKAKGLVYVLPGLLLVATFLSQTHRLTSNKNLPAAEQGGGAAAGLAPAVTQVRPLAQYGNLPLSFEANQGQSDGRVRFLSRGRGYSLFLTPTEAVLALRKSGPPKGHHPMGALAEAEEQDVAQAATAAALRIKLVGVNPAPRITGEEELPGKANYFIGNDPKKWRTNVPTYAKVRYHGIYAGVDLVYYGKQRELEHDFVVRPGADPKAITLGFAGADKLSLDAQGNLTIHTGGEEVVLRAPVSYQESKGVKEGIESRYVLKGKQQVGFELAAYDPRRPLIIDPVLSYSTYLGGSGDEEGRAIAVDSGGNAYVTGFTGGGFPTTTGASQTTYGGGNFDAFVTKLSADGSSLVYSTYLGGSGFDEGTGVAVDSGGHAYVTGDTSGSFPTTTGASQTTFGGGFTDAFVTKLSADGSSLIYSTYLGGSGFDLGRGIAVDSGGNAYVSGTTDGGFPTTAGASQTSYGGGSHDAFVSKLSADGSSLVYSTYLGGSGSDGGSGIAVDSGGNAYVTGFTKGGFPTTTGASQATYGGGRSDAFVSKLSADGSSLVYSTYLGGSGFDGGSGIAVDSGGNAYVTGATNSTNFPTTTGAFQTTSGGGGDAFVTKLSADGSSLVYSTYLGGSGGGAGSGIAVDSGGNAYVTGASSVNFPTTAGAPQTTFGGGGADAFVTKLNADGSSLVYSTYLGGSGYDQGFGIAVDSGGNAYVSGRTTGSFPTTTGASQTTFGGDVDAFVAKIGPTISDLTALVNSFNLPHGIANSLLDKLQNAEASVAAGNLTAACGQLNAFINEVSAQSGKNITVGQANELIALANGVRTGLGCP